jgi:hypothetical protein
MLPDGPDAVTPGREAVSALMPDLLADLARLVAIPSVSVPGRIDEPLLDAFALTSELFAGAGVESGAARPAGNRAAVEPTTPAANLRERKPIWPMRLRKRRRPRTR